MEAGWRCFENWSTPWSHFACLVACHHSQRSLELWQVDMEAAFEGSCSLVGMEVLVEKPTDNHQNLTPN